MNIRSLLRHRPAPEPVDLSQPVDTEAAMEAARLVNAGDTDAANAVCERTDNPRATAFAAFRWID